MNDDKTIILTRVASIKKAVEEFEKKGQEDNIITFPVKEETNNK